MDTEFARILRGLMENRGLTRRSISRATGRAESTINLLMTGNTAPRADLLIEIAPILELNFSDLLVIAGLPADTAPPNERRMPYQATEEIGVLLAAVSGLMPAQVEKLTQEAKAMKASNRERLPD